jgi:peptide/nickel transport system substrate-binding protein
MSQNEQFAKLYDQALGGKLSRRVVLRRALALGLSVPAISALLAACGSDDKATNTVASGGTTPASATNTTASGSGGASPTTGASATAGSSPTKAGSPVAGGSPTSSASPVAGGERQGPGDPTMGQTIEPAGKTGGTLIEGSISDISTVMPVVSDDDASNDFQALMFDSLIQPDPFTLLPVGALAEQWESNADATEWTVYLRKNVTWHDGEPLVADDVKLTYDLHMNADTGSSYTADLTSKIKSVDVVDDNTVKFTMTDTLVDFPLDVAVYGIIASHIWKDTAPADVKTDKGATGEDPSRVVGTGPFKFKEWVTGEQATAEKYDSYWGGDTNLDTYIYKVVPDQSAGVQQLKTGEVDFFQGVSPSSVAEFDNSPDVTVTAANRLSFTFYGTNMDPAKTTLFQDVEVRQALLYAIDREALVKDIQFGFAKVAVGTMPPLSWAYNPDGIEMKYEYDEAKANELLDSAGWVDSNNDGVREKDGKDLAFTAYTNAGNQVRESYLTALQEFWSKIGVKMTPQLEPFPQLVDRITTSHDFEMALLGFGWSAAPDQSAMWATDSYNGGFNMVKYSNPQVDDLLKQANRELDQQKRIDLYTQMQNILMQELPMAILDFPQLPTGVNKRVHNVFASDINTYWDVNSWWVE